MLNYITRVNDIGCDNSFWNDTVFGNMERRFKGLEIM